MKPDNRKPDFVPKKFISPESRNQPSAINTNTNILLVNDEHSSTNIYNEFPSFPSTPSNTCGPNNATETLDGLIQQLPQLI